MNSWRTLFKILGLILLMFVLSVFAQNIAISWHLLSLLGFEYVLHGLTYVVVAMVMMSVIFAMVHLFNGRLTGIDFYLLIIGGTMVGILYAIATYRYNSIWASIVLHMCWNIGSLITISPTQTDDGWIQYVINSHNVWLTGGAYGFSVSIFAIIGYMITAIVILFLKKDRRF